MQNTTLRILTKITLIAGLTSTILACGQESAKVTQSEVSVTESVSSHSSIRQSAKDVGTKATDWQLAHLDNFDYIPESHRVKSSDPKFWIQAAFYIGLTRWTETTEDKNIVAHIEAMAKGQNYQLLPQRPMHADDHTIGQTYLWLSEQTGNQDAYKPTQLVFDEILKNPPTNGLELIESDKHRAGFESGCQDRWCWADALFMAPRTWLKMSNVTGDPKYFEYGDQEYWAAADYLFSDDYGLFFRDSRYFDMKSDNGEPVFWSRGNGWVFAALPLIIDDIPQGHPSKARYIELYKKNAAGLVELQNENGYWPASLRDPNKVKTPEVSGTGFITFGIAWGVNNGILSGDEYVSAAEKGWAALADAVDEDGRVNWVQQVGKSPDPVKKTDTQLYGVGAVLLAASEMTKWQSKSR